MQRSAIRDSVGDPTPSPVRRRQRNLAPKWLGAYWQPNPLMPVSRVQVRDPDPCGTEAGKPAFAW